MNQTEITEGQSARYPERMNVIVQAESFDGCQTQVELIMDREGVAAFTLPVRAADGSWIALGHYPYRKNLPEL